MPEEYAVTVPEDSGNLPFPLDGSSDLGRQLRPRHWVGICVLAGTVALAAIALPPLISPGPEPPRTAPQAAGPRAPSPAGSAPEARAGDFPPVSVEAEDPGNTMSGGAEITTCAACEGGARVQSIGSGSGTLVVRATVPATGTREVVVTYETDGDRTVKVALGGTTVSTAKVGGDGRQSPRTYRFTTAVPEGAVDLTFFNDDGPAPDIDKITIT
jgi:hypothetical protein